MDASLAVAAYLQPRWKPGWGLFSLRGSGGSSSTSGVAPTLLLARQVSKGRLFGLLVRSLQRLHAAF